MAAARGLMCPIHSRPSDGLLQDAPEVPVCVNPYTILRRNQNHAQQS